MSDMGEVQQQPAVEDADADPDLILEEEEEPVDAKTLLRSYATDLHGGRAVLEKWKKRGVARSELMERFVQGCSEQYEYLPELVELFTKLFAPLELLEFLEANESPRPMVIRTNTLKTSRRVLAKALTARGVHLEPLAAWSKVGLKIFKSSVPVGATPEYLSGHYMLQSASSFAPVIALGPKPGERILDMCSAPGGKTTYIAQLMKNKGILVANDLKKHRLPSTIMNLARLGVRHSIVVNQDGRAFPKTMGGFDRVLLDAPCSGLGVIAHDPSIKTTRTVPDILRTAHLQKELLLSAIDSVNHRSSTGGVIVYSTCSISVEENEQVVQYALEKRKVRLVDTGLSFGKEGLLKHQEHRFDASMKLTRRLYPHVHNMDGFYVAKFVKYDRELTAEEEEEKDVLVESVSTNGADVTDEKKRKRSGEAKRGNDIVEKKRSKKHTKKG